MNLGRLSDYKSLLLSALMLGASGDRFVPRTDEPKLDNRLYLKLFNSSKTAKELSLARSLAGLKEGNPEKLLTNIYEIFGWELPSGYGLKLSEIKGKVRAELDKKKLLGVKNPSIEEALAIYNVYGRVVGKAFPSATSKSDSVFIDRFINGEGIVKAVGSSEEYQAVNLPASLVRGFTDCDTRSLLYAMLNHAFGFEINTEPIFMPGHLVFACNFGDGGPRVYLDNYFLAEAHMPDDASNPGFQANSYLSYPRLSEEGCVANSFRDLNMLAPADRLKILIIGNVLPGLPRSKALEVVKVLKQLYPNSHHVEHRLQIECSKALTALALARMKKDMSVDNEPSALKRKLLDQQLEHDPGALLLNDDANFDFAINYLFQAMSAGGVFDPEILVCAGSAYAFLGLPERAHMALRSLGDNHKARDVVIAAMDCAGDKPPVHEKYLAYSRARASFFYRQPEKPKLRFPDLDYTMNSLGTVKQLEKDYRAGRLSSGAYSRQLDEYISKHPTVEELREQKLKLCVELSQFEDARAVAQNAEKEFQTAKWRFLLLRFQVLTGDLVGAESSAQVLLKTQASMGAWGMSFLELGRGNTESALAWARRGVLADPTSLPLLQQYVGAYKVSPEYLANLVSTVERLKP